MPSRFIKASKQRAIREIFGRVDVAGGVASVGKGADFSVTKIGAGKIKVTFTKPGHQILYAEATPIEPTDATSHAAKVMSKTEATDVTFGIYVAGGAQTDNIPFYFNVVLKDSN